MLRRSTGRIWSLLVRATLLPGLRDPQCGFTCKVLYLSRRRGDRIAEVVAPIHHDVDTRVRLWNDSLHMLADLAGVWLRARRGGSG